MAYMTDHSPPPRYKHWARFLGQRSLYDFIALKLYLRLIEQYTDTGMVLLPESYYKAQAIALRSRAKLMGIDATLEELGRAYYCEGCETWNTCQQHSPLWITCRGDGKLLLAEQEKINRLNHGKRLTVSDHIRKLVPLSRPTAVLDLADGKMWCPRAHPFKQGLQDARAAARKVLREAGVAERPEDDEEVVAAAEASEEEEEEEDEEDLLVDMERVPPHYPEEPEAEESEDDSDDEDEDGSDTEEVVPLDYGLKVPPPIRHPFFLLTAGGQVERQHMCLRARRLLQAACAAVTAHGRQTCRTQPCTSIDMLGVMVRRGRSRGGEWMALCCGCGGLMAVTSMKVPVFFARAPTHPPVRRDPGCKTANPVPCDPCLPALQPRLISNPQVSNMGFSCMNHPHVNESGVSSLQASAWRGLTERLVAELDPFSLPIPGQRPRTDMAPNPHLLDTPVACAYCAQQGTYKQLVVYDTRFRWWYLPLCETHLYCLRVLVPGLKHLGKPIMARCA